MISTFLPCWAYDAPRLAKTVDLPSPGKDEVTRIVRSVRSTEVKATDDRNDRKISTWGSVGLNPAMDVTSGFTRGMMPKRPKGQISRTSSGVLTESSTYSKSATSPRPNSTPTAKPSTPQTTTLGLAWRSGRAASSTSCSGAAESASAMAISYDCAWSAL